MKKVLIYDSNAEACGEINDNNTAIVETDASKEELINIIQGDDEILYGIDEISVAITKRGYACKVIVVGWSAMDGAVDFNLDVYF
jgi:hypothetical protein